MEFPNKTLLVVADSNFHNLCSDPVGYLNNLNTVLSKLYGKDTAIISVTGKYGLSSAMPGIECLEVDSKNKTSFVHSVENKTDLFDDLLIISLVATDQYLEGLATSMTEKHKTIIRYKYHRKG